MEFRQSRNSTGNREELWNKPSVRAAIYAEGVLYEKDEFIFSFGSAGNQRAGTGGLPLGHEHSFGAWEDTGVTQWITKPSDSSKEIEEKEQKRVCSSDGTEELRWVATGDEQAKPPTLPSISGKNIDTFGRVAAAVSSGILHGSNAPNDVAVAAYNTLVDIAAQADELRKFFKDAKTSYPTLSAKFGALQSAEAVIQNQANHTTSITNYDNVVDAQVTAIINKIFEGKDRADFDKYWAAYTKGQYLISADWNTRTDGSGVAANISNAETEFNGLRNTAIAAGGITNTSAGNWDSGRSFSLNIGTNFVTQLTEMQGILKTQILTALELTGVDNADDMADALIIQLGQDNEEFRALVDDIVAEQFNILSEDYSTGESNVSLSSLGSQSTTRLASIDTTFDPEKLKGLSVSKATEMA